ncbi:MAG: hypothetical protein K8L99_07980 [Anaerolineae bacterium]|nr:hypothetical protein [Anaerolineae bacterium]
MKASIYDEKTDEFMGTANLAPVCGEDYCESCGECLACCGEDSCWIYDVEQDEHFWVVYVNADWWERKPESEGE